MKIQESSLHIRERRGGQCKEYCLAVTLMSGIQLRAPCKEVPPDCDCEEEYLDEALQQLSPLLALLDLSADDVARSGISVTFPLATIPPSHPEWGPGI